MKKTRAGARKSHSLTPFLTSPIWSPAALAPRSISPGAIACVMRQSNQIETPSAATNRLEGNARRSALVRHRPSPRGRAIPATGASNASARRALNSRSGKEDRGRTTRPDPRRAFRSTLLHLGLNGLDDLRHGDLRIRLLTLEIGLPDRLADHELLQSEEVVVYGPGPVQLPADQPDERRHPIRLVRIPPGVDRLVGRQLAGMAALGADDRVLPDLRVVGQRLDVLGRLFLVLTILEQGASCRPEHRRALAVGELRQRAQMQELGVIPVRGHPQRRVEVFEVEADPLRGEGDLIRGSVDAGI